MNELPNPPTSRTSHLSGNSGDLNRQNQKVSRGRDKKRMGGWLNNCAFAFSLFALCFPLVFFRAPSEKISFTKTVEPGSGNFGANVLLARNYRAGGTQPRDIAGGAGDRDQRAEYFRARGGAGISVDLDRLAHAVAIAETGNCTRGIGATMNNCFGIKYHGKFKKFSSPQKSYAEFKYIWKKSYGKFPDHALAWKWVCGADAPSCPAATEWLTNVEQNY